MSLEEVGKVSDELQRVAHERDNLVLAQQDEASMGVGTGDTGLFVHGPYNAIKAAQAIVLSRDELRQVIDTLRRQKKTWIPQLKASAEELKTAETERDCLVATVQAVTKKYEASAEEIKELKDRIERTLDRYVEIVESRSKWMRTSDAQAEEIARLTASEDELCKKIEELERNITLYHEDREAEIARLTNTIGILKIGVAAGDDVEHVGWCDTCARYMDVRVGCLVDIHEDDVEEIARLKVDRDEQETRADDIERIWHDEGKTNEEIHTRLRREIVRLETKQGVGALVVERVREAMTALAKADKTP